EPAIRCLNHGPMTGNSGKIRIESHFSRSAIHFIRDPDPRSTANPEKSTRKLLCDGTLFLTLVPQMLLKLAFERFPLMISERGGRPL
ncbi:MAG TPA: hypothetical protein VJN95_07780, partial [Gemmatimonadales bacterium]|nr:hypothetical protein [Gemmatimonadales bacterium]